MTPWYYVPTALTVFLVLYTFYCFYVHNFHTDLITMGVMVMVGLAIATAWLISWLVHLMYEGIFL